MKTALERLLEHPFVESHTTYWERTEDGDQHRLNIRYKVQPGDIKEGVFDPAKEVENLIDAVLKESQFDGVGVDPVS